MCNLIEWVRSISHRVTQKNRHTKAHKDSGPSPDPSPGGKGSDHRDTPIRRISALCCPLLVSTIVLTLCDICMPEAFCGLEMCAKRLSELCALCERKTYPRLSSVFFFSQKNTEEQNTQTFTETLSQPISQNITANVS